MEPVTKEGDAVILELYEDVLFFTACVIVDIKNNRRARVQPEW